MKRTQITLRVWIVAIAVLAVGFAASISAYHWLLRMQRIRKDYLALAAEYARDEQFSKAEWQRALISIEGAKVRVNEMLEQARKSGLEETDLSQLVNSANGVVNQAADGASFWFEDMNYNSSMKEEYLNAASRPWRDAPAYRSKSSFQISAKKGGIRK